MMGKGFRDVIDYETDVWYLDGVRTALATLEIYYDMDNSREVDCRLDHLDYGTQDQIDRKDIPKGILWDLEQQVAETFLWEN